MVKLLTVILGVIFIGILVVLCFFSCILSTMSDDYWEEVKKRLEGKK